MVDVARRGRLRKFGHVKLKSEDDWVSAYRSQEVVGIKGRDRGRKTYEECVKQDLVLLDLKLDRIMRRSLTLSLPAYHCRQWKS